jgi:hypothetical protein
MEKYIFIYNSAFSFSPLMKKHYLKAIAFFLLFFAIVNQLIAQTSIPLNTPVKQDFNSMAAGLPLPANWQISAAGAGTATTWATGLSSVTQAANIGSSTTGGAYNWGTTAGTDRAVGFLTSGGYASPNALMAYFRNTTGAAVTTLTISFNVERYRVNTSDFSLSFFSSVDGTAWTARNAGDISAGIFASGASSYTFDTPTTITKTVTLSGLNIASNADIYFRWVFTNAVAANAQGLGLDDVTLYAGTPAPAVAATLKYMLKTDSPPTDQANSGDELTYRTAIKNLGTGDASSVVLTEPAPTNTTFVGGSVKTSTMARDETFTTPFNTLLSGGNVITNDYGIPSPAVISFGPTANPAATLAGGSGSSNNAGAVVVNANGTFTYTPATGFSGKDQFGYIAGNGNLPDNDAVVTVTVGSAPIANADSYNVVGNVSISPNSAAGILSNDTGGGLLVSAVNGNAANVDAAIVTSGGGNLTVNANGSFTYNPAPGFTGSDNFTYTADNGFSTPTGATTVTLNVAGVVWFVNNNAVSNGDGRLSSPFKLITNVTGTAAGQTIFFYESATAYSGSITLLGTQKLIGQDASQSLATITGLTPNATYSAQFPAMDNGNGTVVSMTATNANIITLNNGNTVRGMTIGNAGTGKKITGSSFGTLTLGNTATPDVILNGTGQAMDLQTGTIGGGLTSLATTSSATQGVLIQSVAGTYNFGPTTVSGSTSQGILISLASSIIPTFGVTTVSAGTDGVSIQGNTGNVTFSSLGITTTNGVGLLGTNNIGQIIVSNNTSGISSTGGPAISLSQASGTSTVNLNFSSLTSTGGTNGVHLNNIAGTIVGGSGSLTGSGTVFNITGGSVSVTYSGGLSKATAGAMVSIANHATGIITFQTGTLSATNGTGLQFDNADGIYNFDGATSLNGGDAGIDILNGSNGTFSFSANTSVTNPTGIAIDINTSTAGNITYSGTFTKSSTGIGIQVNAKTGGTVAFNGTGTKTLSTSTSVAVNLTGNAGATINFSGDNLLLTTTTATGFNATGGGTINVTGTGNTISATDGSAIKVSNTTANFNFSSVNASAGTSNAIAYSSAAGSTTIGGGTISGNSSAPTFFVAGGTASITYSGSITQANNASLVSIGGGHQTGTITFQTGTLSATNGTGLQFDNADGIYNFNGTTTLNGGDAGIDILNGSNGTFSFAATTSVTNPTGTAININTSSAGNITYSGTFSKSSTGIGIQVNAKTGGTVAFNGSGTKTLSTTTSAAVSLTGNAGGVVNFSGNNLVLTTTTGTGVNATGGGTITLTGTGNTITSVGGTALNINATTIGAGNLNFQSISANGGASGISLNTTGAGGLVVTGTGTTDGTGGTIQNISTRGISVISGSNINLKNINLVSANSSVDGGGAGACDDLIIGSCNAAMYLNGVSTIALDNINLSGTMVENGITGLNVSNLTMNNCTINGAGNEAHESGMEMQNLSGTCAVTNTSITFSETNNLDIVNTDVNLTLTIDASSFNDTQTVSSGGMSNSNGEGGFQFRSFSSVAGIPVSTIKIKNSSFLRLRTQGIQAIAEDDTKLNIDITNCTINSVSDIGAGIDINGNDNSEVNFNVIGNPIIHSQGGAAVNITSFLDANVMGRVNDNPAITVNSIGSGVRAVAQETSNLVVEVKNNGITMGSANNSTPIDMQARFETARIDITLDNNNLNSDPTAVADINIIAGSSNPNETNPRVYVNFINNDVAAGGPMNVLRLRVSDLDGTTNPLMYLTGFVEGGSAVDDDAVATWNGNSNTPLVTAANINVSLTGTATAPLSGTALTPTNALP